MFSVLSISLLLIFGELIRYYGHRFSKIETISDMFMFAGLSILDIFPYSTYNFFGVFE